MTTDSNAHAIGRELAGLQHDIALLYTEQGADAAFRVISELPENVLQSLVMCHTVQRARRISPAAP